MSSTTPNPLSQPAEIGTGGRPGRLLWGYAVLTVVAALRGVVAADWWTPGPAAGIWITAAYGYWMAISFVLLQIGLGACLLPLHSSADNRRLATSTKLLLWFGAGSYLACAALMLLSLLGMLNVISICVLAIAEAIISVYAWRRQRAKRNARDLDSTPAAASWARRGVVIVLFFWSLPFLIVTLLPNCDWDGDLFHLPFAERLLNEGLLATDLVFEAYNYPGAEHLFYGAFLLADAEAAVIPLNFLLGLGVLLGVYALGCELWSEELGLLAVLVCLTINVLWEVAITPRIDTSLAFYTVVGVLAFLLWRREPRRGVLLAVCGASVGMTLGIKYTAVFGVAVLGSCVLIAAAYSLFIQRIRVLGALVAATLLVCLPSGFW